ncbi:DoxX-like family protein [Sessilibacter sp. MAH4]
MRQLTPLLCARFVLAFMWIYQGLVPKLMRVAPVELEITAQLGFSVNTTYLLIKLVGLLEVLFGVLVFFAYRNIVVLIVNLVALLLLVVMALVLTPHIMLAAFNPIITNLPYLVLGYWLLQSAKRAC